MAPKGYTAITKDASEIWSKTAQTKLNALLKEADECDPDSQGLCKYSLRKNGSRPLTNMVLLADIYNDFYGYACIDIIEKQVEQIFRICNSKAKTKGPTSKAAIYQLESLILWMCMEDAYAGVDHGDRFEALMKCVGAACHYMARSLAEEGKLNEKCRCCRHCYSYAFIES